MLSLIVEQPRPPETYLRFTRAHPGLSVAWEQISKSGADGPLDQKTQRLVKLAIAMGAMREGAVHSSVRKARAMGITEQEMQQVVALAAGTMGMPSTVALFSWVSEA